MISLTNHQGRYNVMRKAQWIVSLCVFALLTGTAFATGNLVQDQRVTTEYAKSLADRANINSEFQVVINSEVVQALNVYVGTPTDRNKMKAALQRMEVYQNLIRSKLTEYEIPSEFIAIPIIESGYQNLEESNRRGWGAGIWMFIKSTARNFGIRVDDVQDDRLNVQLLTDAAMRYLKSNFMRFQNWNLSILSYNMGEGQVQRAINQLETRDPWKIVKVPGQHDSQYLAKLMAAIIVMKNPELLK